LSPTESHRAHAAALIRAGQRVLLEKPLTGTLDAAFVDCCRTGQPFPTSHGDGLRAQQVISAGMPAVFTEEHAARVEAASAASSR